MFGDIYTKLRGYYAIWFGTQNAHLRGILEFKGSAVTSVTDDVTNQRTVVQLDVSNTNALAAISGQTIAPGAITMGPMKWISGTGATTGTASATLLTTSMPASTVLGLSYAIVGWNSTDQTWYLAGAPPGAGFGTGGTPGPEGTAGTETSAMGISPSVTGTWSAGTFSLVVTGPQATITAAADNGGGKVRLTVSGSPLDASLTGKNVTISGLTTCFEANGTHQATYVGGNAFDLLTVTAVHTGADSGTVVPASATQINWSAWAMVLTP